MAQSLKVLFVTTSHDKLGDTTGKTGVWFEELAGPYYVFKDAGAFITIASPNGGPVPLDPKSESIITVTYRTKRFKNDAEAMHHLNHSLLLSEVKADNFDMIFLPGGHGPLWDLADNKLLSELLLEFDRKLKPIVAVCHGVVGLVPLQNENGEPWIKGKNLTGFSNSEEKSTGLNDVIPYLLETKLISLGASYSKGDDYVSYVVADENLITGQNPDSSVAAAKKALALIKLSTFSVLDN